MQVELTTPHPDGLDAPLSALASRQRDGLPIQLHPGDLGWRWRFGSAELAGALRVWRVDREIVAIGLLDRPSLIRIAVAPSAEQGEELAQAVGRDLKDPARGALSGDEVVVEARFGVALRSLLQERGWVEDESWTPLVRGLRDPVEDCGLRVETVGPDHVGERVTVQRAAFDRSTFTADLWDVMSRSTAYRQARCLVGYDDRDRAVAAVTVWSAGEGRPGLLEPLGVHRDHRGRGHGTAIGRAAAAALRELGASSALVATPSANVSAVAAYGSAGFRRMPEITDLALRRSTRA